MSVSQSQELLKFAHIQMAAEALLGGLNPESERDQLINALIVGNRRASAFPVVLAGEFADEWVVVSHRENAAGSGFSGTLFRSRSPNSDAGTHEYALAFRSTEFVDDSIRDATSTGDL
jgi:hypothetical protein